jgi:hypothetical protein
MIMRKWWYKIPLFIALAIVAVLVFGYIVSALWNWLIPVLFHGPVITFWQAIGLLILSRILFRGFHFGRHGGWRHRGEWRKRWQEKMANMTPEEREKFREEWRRRCRGPWGRPPAEEKKDTM